VLLGIDDAVLRKRGLPGLYERAVEFLASARILDLDETRFQAAAGTRTSGVINDRLLVNPPGYPGVGFGKPSHLQQPPEPRAGSEIIEDEIEARIIGTVGEGGDGPVPSREQSARGKRVPVELNEAVREKLTLRTETDVAGKMVVAIGDRRLFGAGPALNGKKPVRIRVGEPVIDREIAAGPYQLTDESGLAQEFAIGVKIEDGLVVRRHEMANEIGFRIRKILGASGADRAMHRGHLVDRIRQSELLARSRQTCRFFDVIGREHRPGHVGTRFAAPHCASGLKGNGKSLCPVHAMARGGVGQIAFADWMLRCCTSCDVSDRRQHAEDRAKKMTARRNTSSKNPPFPKSTMNGEGAEQETQPPKSGVAEAHPPS